LSYTFKTLPASYLFQLHWLVGLSALLCTVTIEACMYEKFVHMRIR